MAVMHALHPWYRRSARLISSRNNRDRIFFYISRPRLQPKPDRDNSQRRRVGFYPRGLPFKAGHNAVRRQQKRVRVSQRASQGFRVLVVLLHPLSRKATGTHRLVSACHVAGTPAVHYDAVSLLDIMSSVHIGLVMSVLHARPCEEGGPGVETSVRVFCWVKIFFCNWGKGVSFLWSVPKIASHWRSTLINK